MQLFGRQDSNFLRFYSNLLDAVFLLYDLTYLLSRVQWQVTQYLIDFITPTMFQSDQLCQGLFSPLSSLQQLFLSPVSPLLYRCAHSSLQPTAHSWLSLLCTQLCSQPLHTPSPDSLSLPPAVLSPPQTLPTSRATSLGMPGLKWKRCGVTATHFTSLSQPFPRHTPRL